MADLFERIAAALTTEAAAGELVVLIAFVDDRDGEVSTLLAEAEKASVDPLTPTAKAEKAAASAFGLTLERKRLQAARAQLSERLADVEARARAAERQKRYDAAVADRDGIARDLVKLYPELAGKLAKLFERMAANSAELTAVGATAGNDAEFQARGVAFNRNDRLIANVRLPGFEPDAPPLWPPRGQSYR